MDWNWSLLSSIVIPCWMPSFWFHIHLQMLVNNLTPSICREMPCCSCPCDGVLLIATAILESGLELGSCESIPKKCTCLLFWHGVFWACKVMDVRSQGMVNCQSDAWLPRRPPQEYESPRHIGYPLTQQLHLTGSAQAKWDEWAGGWLRAGAGTSDLVVLPWADPCSWWVT
jgi:hypothetical protein